MPKSAPLKKPYLKPTISRLDDSRKEPPIKTGIPPSANSVPEKSPTSKPDTSEETFLMLRQTELDPLIPISADVVSAYISNNPLPAPDLPNFIHKIYSSLKAISAGATPAAREELSPAVPIKRSITPNFIICLEDGRHFKSLKRHIAVRYGLTPDQYRSKWNLPFDYPMVAPNYSANRSRLAKSMGLGRRAK